MYRQYVQSGIAPGANTVTTSAIAANTIQPWQLSSSLLNPTVNSFTGDGTTTSFTLSLPPASANTVVVTVNGITQSPVTNYSTNNTSLVFTSAPSNASVIRAVQQAMIGTSIVPIDGSVTTSKLGSSLTLSGNTSFSGAISGTSATLSSTLGVTGVTTLTAQPILSSLTASSAVATDASKGLVSVTNTGSGNNVLSASPTLTGTVAAASLSLSSLTSGRVTYAGASGLLSDNANFVYDANGNLGIGTSSLNISSGSSGSQVITISASASGRNALLELKGTRTSANQVSSYIRSFSNSATSPGVDFQFYRGATDTDGFLTISTSGTERMRITSDGNVGINVTSPSMKLDVSSGATTATAIFTSTATTAYSPTTSASVTNARLTLFGGNATNAYTAIRFTHSGSYENFFGAVQSSAGTGQFVWGGYNGSSYGEWMRLDSSGNLGLGVTPSVWAAGRTALEIGGSTTGNIAFNGNATNGYQIWCNSYFNAGSNFYYANGLATNFGSGSGLFFWNLAPNNTSGAGAVATFTRAMTLSDSGNLSINPTNDGGYGIDIYRGNSGGYLNSWARITDSGGQMSFQQIDTTGSAGFSWKQSSNSGSTFTTSMILDSSGNLSVGTTSAFARLTTSTSAGSAGQVNGQIAMTHASATTAYYISTIRGAGTNEPEGLTFKENATERMRIDASGNLLVGATTKETRGVTIYGSGANGLYLKTTGTTNYWITNDGAGTGAGLIATIYNDTTIAGTISVNSNTTAFTSISDYRLKENVQPMTSGLAKVSQLKPVTYTWKVDGASGQGFIAHELAEVVPECVVGEKDAIDEHGNIKPQSVDTSFLVATLVSAIQELKAEFDAYKETHP